MDASMISRKYSNYILINSMIGDSFCLFLYPAKPYMTLPNVSFTKRCVTATRHSHHHKSSHGPSLELSASSGHGEECLVSLVHQERSWDAI